MNSEITALEENDTWSLVPLPVGHHPIGCRWVFKIKYQFIGSIERYNARLVAKGFTQHEGIDYTKTFAPIAKHFTICCLLTIAFVCNWSLHRWTCIMLFFMVTFIKKFTCFHHLGTIDKGEYIVCRLHKSLYGLKQSSQNWFHKFSSAI